eukprot:5567098-Pyramimonas_sp.AAC.1
MRIQYFRRCTAWSWGRRSSHAARCSSLRFVNTNANPILPQARCLELGPTFQPRGEMLFSKICALLGAGADVPAARRDVLPPRNPSARDGVRPERVLFHGRQRRRAQGVEVGMRPATRMSGAGARAPFWKTARAM